MGETTLTKVEKIEATLKRLHERLAKFNAHAYDKKYQKRFPIEPVPMSIVPILPKLDGKSRYTYDHVPGAVQHSWEYWRDCDHAMLIEQINMNMIKLEEAKAVAARKAAREQTKTREHNKIEQQKAIVIRNVANDIKAYHSRIMERVKARMYTIRETLRARTSRYEKTPAGYRYPVCDATTWTTLRSERSDELIEEYAQSIADEIVGAILTRMSKSCGEIDHFVDQTTSDDFLLNTHAVTTSGKEVKILVISAGGYNIQRFHYRVRISNVD